ncbi:hypothetical protein MGYG_06535 [Nannizzia gypsea CBS 118893]|uniref:Uncharacterized protein n=1 Tax=Arthroderma gypseum (strain ATCC MYA-4604 / CBS 118893) TaxID=535722 RepID=E4UZK9_ARTGP|nr:hypothetical protein MGYG_06535 [Nannizzia gypsea CBS 118893]EFR03539.1 hypothetical protein MGYG_06535 [Nannizzia gypsea CBS 118893]
MMWKPSLFDDSDGEVTAVHADDETSPYLLDDLDAFESCLSSMGSMRSTKENAVTPLTPVTVKSAFDLNETLVDGVGSADDLIHHRGSGNSLNTTDSDDDEFFTSSSSPPTPAKALPWDGYISWTDTMANTDFSKLEGRASGFGSSVELVAHGLVYTPRFDDKDAYRTVLLTKLPLDVDMRTLLSAIRGGAVFSAHIMNMEEFAGYHMGVVTFVRGKAASAYVNFAINHGVYFNDARVNVCLSKTPTYPIPKAMQNNIVNQLFSRCLVIQGDRDPNRYSYIAKNLKNKIRLDFEMGDRMTENAEETEINIRFSSIRAADNAYGILRSLLRECTVSFALDPCAQPLPGAEVDEESEDKCTIELACADPWM